MDNFAAPFEMLFSITFAGNLWSTLFKQSGLKESSSIQSSVAPQSPGDPSMVIFIVNHLKTILCMETILSFLGLVYVKIGINEYRWWDSLYWISELRLNFEQNIARVKPSQALLPPQKSLNKVSRCLILEEYPRENSGKKTQRNNSLSKFFAKNFICPKLGFLGSKKNFFIVQQ